jgi:hypothetical protein
MAHKLFMGNSSTSVFLCAAVQYCIHAGSGRCCSTCVWQLHEPDCYGGWTGAVGGVNAVWARLTMLCDQVC